MAISVKGIQYSYQIDLFSQVPTRLKSQVHNLPSLSVLEATPIDENNGQEMVIPNNEVRRPFAGVNAAPSNENPTIRENIGADLTPIVSSSATPANQPPPPQLQQPYADVSLQPAENRVEGKPDFTENLFAPPAFQPQNNQRLSPAVESEDFPSADRSPIEPVKGMPKSEFLRAQKAYNPDYGSYLQATGYESPMQSGVVKDEPAITAINRPGSPTPNPQNRVEMTNTSTTPAIQAQPQEKLPELTTEAELRTQTQEQNVPNLIQSFMERQAQKVYALFGTSDLVSNSNRVDMYF